MRANNLAGQRRVGLRKSVVFPKSRLPSLRSPVVWLRDPGLGGTVLEKVRLGVRTMEVDVIYGYVERKRAEIEMCFVRVIFLFFCFLKTQVIHRNIRVTCEVIQRDKILYMYVYIYIFFFVHSN